MGENIKEVCGNTKTKLYQYLAFYQFFLCLFKILFVFLHFEYLVF